MVLDPAGGVLYRSPSDRIPYTSDRVPPNPSQINDPTGGMIRVRLKDDGSNYLLLLDAIDASGGIRWTRQVPETWPDTGIVPVPIVGVDRKGNVLVVWGLSSGERKAQWLDHEGNAGPVFMTSGFSTLIPRVGDGFFVRSIYGGTESVWVGQFEPFATTMSKPPDWLPVLNADATLHMVHGGRGYAVVPGRGASDNCEQSVSVISPSGQLCGIASFSVGGGSCYLAPMVVGYDGTVVQQLPRDRENACPSPYTSCDCTYRYWPGYFR